MSKMGTRNRSSEEMYRVFNVYADILDILKKHCAKYDIVEFLPPRHVAGYAHIPELHFTFNFENRDLILPYQQTIFNRLSTHFLDRETFCIGPCYRKEILDERHLNSFYQFTFELYSDDLWMLISRIQSILSDICSFFDLDIGNPRLIDFRESGPYNDDEILSKATESNVPIIVAFKRRGIPPFINKTYNEALEVATEVIFPVVGEVFDGGVRDPNIILQLYGVRTTKPTCGASIGLERLVGFILRSQNITNSELL
jgi:aspartyl/asparaginyl-tRNA synthetase